MSSVYACDSLREERESLHKTRLGLDPNLYEELTNSQGKPRLNVARKMLLNEGNLHYLGFKTFEDVLGVGEELFSMWRDLSEFMVLRKEYVGHGEPRPDQYFAVKCSKRGNDVYQRRIKTRLAWLDCEIPDKKFFEIRDFQVNKAVKTSLLWVTLTFDTKRGSRIYAWEQLGKDFNRFMSALRSRYGKISYIRVWESYESGYPHVHVVMFFHEARFSVFPHWSESNAKERGLARPGFSCVAESTEKKLTFRISEKAAISEFWHSHVDVQAISSLRAVFTYLKKHQEKIILGLSGSIQEGGNSTVGFDLENVRGLRSLFLCWIFRKRSFSVSGCFREVLGDLISHLHNSKMLKQMDLALDGENRWCGKVVEEWAYTFLGIWDGSELGIPSFIWAKKLDLDVISPLVDAKARFSGR